MIRNARLEDYKEVEQMMQQVQNLHVTWRPDIYQPIKTVLSIEEYQEMIKDETIIIAEREGKVCAVSTFLERTYQNPTHVKRKVLFVDTMVVDQSHRGQGIGTRMFEYLKNAARVRNCDGIELQVNARNTAAKQMYEKCGFTEKSINMELMEL